MSLSGLMLKNRVYILYTSSVIPSMINVNLKKRAVQLSINLASAKALLYID
jgi:hypothetical protein